MQFKKFAMFLPIALVGLLAQEVNAQVEQNRLRNTLTGAGSCLDVINDGDNNKREHPTFYSIERSKPYVLVQGLRDLPLNRSRSTIIVTVQGVIRECGFQASAGHYLVLISHFFASVMAPTH